MTLESSRVFAGFESLVCAAVSPSSGAQVASPTLAVGVALVVLFVPPQAAAVRATTVSSATRWF